MLLRLLALCGFGILAINAADVEVVNQWNLLDFNFPYDFDTRNDFRPDNTVFTGLEVSDDRIFIAMPRLRAGVPATVAVIPRHTPPQSSPVLQAYPDWSFHAAGRGANVTSCDGIISVYRLRSDSCNRLWILDSGVITSLDDFRVVCPPKILIVDLRTDQVVRTVIFPREVLRPASLFTNLVIDESVGVCDDAVVYITDTAAPGLVVYDSSKDRTWRFMHPTMFPDPDFSDYTIDGDTFTLMDGIIGLAHSPASATLYYQPLATDRIFSVSTNVLRKGPLAEGVALPVTLVGRKASQGVGLAVDLRDDTLYFSPLEQTSVASWNPKSNQQQLIAYDLQQLQFPTEVRWIDRDGGSIWALTTRFQKYFKRNYNSNEINLRIIRIPLRTAPSYPINNNIFFKK